MAKLQHNGKQFSINLSEELVKQMKWEKGDDIYIGKDIGKDMLYMIKNE